MPPLPPQQQQQQPQHQQQADWHGATCATPQADPSPPQDSAPAATPQASSQRGSVKFESYVAVAPQQPSSAAGQQAAPRPACSRPVSAQAAQLAMQQPAMQQAHAAATDDAAALPQQPAGRVNKQAQHPPLQQHSVGSGHLQGYLEMAAAPPASDSRAGGPAAAPAPTAALAAAEGVFADDSDGWPEAAWQLDDGALLDAAAAGGPAPEGGAAAAAPLSRISGEGGPDAARLLATSQQHAADAKLQQPPHQQQAAGGDAPMPEPQRQQPGAGAASALPGGQRLDSPPPSDADARPAAGAAVGPPPSLHADVAAWLESAAVAAGGPPPSLDAEVSAWLEADLADFGAFLAFHVPALAADAAERRAAAARAMPACFVVARWVFVGLCNWSGILTRWIRKPAQQDPENCTSGRARLPARLSHVRRTACQLGRMAARYMVVMPADAMTEESGAVIATRRSRICNAHISQSTSA